MFPEEAVISAVGFDDYLLPVLLIEVETLVPYTEMTSKRIVLKG
jgi:hypothetical protein